MLYGWIAQIVFAVLVILGAAFGELGPRALAVTLAIWCAVFVTARYVPAFPASTIVAVLDIVLVFVIFKGDLELR
jgi:hypothetical protein